LGRAASHQFGKRTKEKSEKAGIGANKYLQRL